ncbi:hypothetical protein [Pseudomonas sp. PDM26]|uniref:hypothetical protein n=1 Tax=Pseudomonas sp. PDM26 TaxID=2854766 RepID=UPI00210D8E4C|nr:hypothetical protein [Pseudomonas sp. PDM26]
MAYETSTNNVWITEVKSSGRGADKTSCSATSALLRLARDDLKKRLAEPELNHWLNAINAAKNAIHNKANYRDSVIEILELEGHLAEENGATASDNNVFLISALFSDVTQAIAEKTVSKFTTKLVADAVFKTVRVHLVQQFPVVFLRFLDQRISVQIWELCWDPGNTICCR